MPPKAWNKIFAITPGQSFSRSVSFHACSVVWIWAPVLLCPYSISASSTTHFHSHRVPWEVIEIHLYCQYEFLLYDEFSTVFCCFFFLLYFFFYICLFLAKAAMLTKAYEGHKGISIEGELWDLQNSVYWEKCAMERSKAEPWGCVEQEQLMELVENCKSLNQL